MAYDQFMQSYLGIGPLASRPATLNIKPGVAAFYYAVDVGELCIWDAGTWYMLATGSTTLAGDSDVAIVTPTDAQVLTYVAADGKWENRAAAGGSSGAETKLDEVVVGVGGQPNIPFSGINQTYKHLRLELTGRGDGAVNNVNLLMRLNGDGGANYDWQYIAGAGTSSTAANSRAATSAQVAQLSGASSPSGAPGGMSLVLRNYTSTIWRKTGETLSDYTYDDSSATGFVSFKHSFAWRSTATVTSILLFPASGNFAQGTVASLYGIS